VSLGAKIAGGRSLLWQMDEKRTPTISAVVAAYQAEDFIAEALESILGQTRPPDEVVVVDDGSTDGTARELERFAGRVRVVRQANGGCPAAFNTAFREARGDYVAMCGADDIWEPHKLEWQAQTIAGHPEADVLFGHAVVVGRVQGEHQRPPISGLLDGEAFRNALFRQNCVCAPTVVIRRSLFERLGPFVEDFGADDYEYWFRCLRAGARFYYDPRPLMSWRQHENNLSARGVWMDECMAQVLRWYQADVRDRAVVCEGFSTVLFRSARRFVDEGKPDEARQAFREALGYAHPSTAFDSARALAWVAILGLPVGARESVGRALVGTTRAVKAAAGRPGGVSS
jgi:glycosyltransferase involved in cell wall biosynthesis